MLRRMLAVVLAALLTGPCFAKTPPALPKSSKEQAAVIPANSPVEVRFINGAYRKGLMTDLSDTGFTLSREYKTGTERTPVNFAEVKDINQIPSLKTTHKTRNGLIIAGVIGGVIILVAALRFDHLYDGAYGK